MKISSPQSSEQTQGSFPVQMLDKATEFVPVITEKYS